VVFIGVPTPTTPDGFDYSIVESAVGLVADGAIAVIKSTILPGTTAKVQQKYPDKIILFSPEFLSEKTAAYDVANPIVNVVGISIDNDIYRKAAEKIMSIFPESKHNFIVSAESAELFKYAHNLNGYFRVILSNLLYDVGEKIGANWHEVKPMMDCDVMMSPYYNDPIHKGGRGAGGNCFIKDMAAFRYFYENEVEDEKGLVVLKMMEEKNLELLKKTNKNQDLVEKVFGKL
jgi:UDPglucose 6-dehydrogenase